MIAIQKDGLTVFQSTLWKTTSSVLETDDLILVVDPTWLPNEIKEIQEHVAHIRNGKDLYLLFTHAILTILSAIMHFPMPWLSAARACRSTLENNTNSI